MTSRRRLLQGGAALTASAWAAPSVVTLDRAAAATPSGAAEIPQVSGGAVFLPTPPPNLAEGGPLDSNSETYVFVEQTCVTLTSPLNVNRVTSGSFGGNSNEGASIPAGTAITSYYVHGDRLDDSGTLPGGVSFVDRDILGLIYRTTELNASNFLRNASTTYVQGPMESNDNMTMTLSAGADTLSWVMRFGPHLDQIRIITSC